MAELQSLRELWVRAFTNASNVLLEPGLSDDELEAAEAAYQVQFPPDLRALLQTALPVDSRGLEAKAHQVPNWRNLSDFRIFDRLNAPWLGALFDIANGAERAWPVTWGEAPTTVATQIREFRKRFDAAPRLVPVFSHRYIPAEPNLPGNPVFSVHQLDIIYYGSDLADYLGREFFRVSERKRPEIGDVRRIPLWSELAEQD